MSRIHDPVTEQDLHAYVDDQLDAARRVEVAEWLGERPAEAARIMADTALREQLKLAMALDETPPHPAAIVAARRLERGLGVSHVFAKLQKVAAVVLLLGLGWTANEVFEPVVVSQSVASVRPPAYVDDAKRAHGTALIRSAMVSQPEASEYDPGEIRAMTAIVMPDLPDEWQIRDVQIFPSTFGPSVELTANTEEFGPLSIFAVRPGSFDVVKPTLAPGAESSAAFFQVGEVAYAVVAAGNIRELDRAAERLADTLY